MSAAAIEPTELPAGWIRGPQFDLALIAGTAGLAALVTIPLSIEPRLFALITVPYLWLVGYPHLLATYSQIAFDRKSFHAYRRLNLELPIAILALVAATAYAVGTWPLVTVYLYWQWFHFARQSYGISRHYARKAARPLADDRLTTAVLYLWPALGILHRSWQAPTQYLGSEVWTLPVPDLLLACASVATLAATGWWIHGRVRAWRDGTFLLPHTLYVASHAGIFALGYLLIADINVGWLVLSLWHSSQYMLFVWHVNRSRYGTRPDPEHPLLSRVSQPGGVLRYALVFLGLSVVFFGALRLGLEWLAPLALPVSLVVFHSINFHHYTVDAIIWSRRRNWPFLAKPVH